MDMLELIKGRKSIRHFKTEQPPRELILTCLEAALWAPNPTNQQPWKFIVLTGEKLKSVTRVIEESFADAFARKEALPSPPLSEGSAKTLLARKDRAFQHMLSALKEQGVSLQAVGSGNFNFHSAPLGVIFATYPCRDYNYLKSTVAALENFLLAAAARGLGTCWMNAVSICEREIKKALHLSPELLLIDGVAVGYPVEQSPLNQLPRDRLPVEEMTDWLS